MLKLIVRYILCIPFTSILGIWCICDWVFTEKDRDSWEMLKNLWKGKL